MDNVRNCDRYINIINLGCLHPVARVISYDIGFYSVYATLISYDDILLPDDGRTTETCRYVCISNISSYDIKVA
jgi:hypothetical protein